MQSKITCPECRKEATVPKGVKQLPINFFVNRLVDELINKRTKEGDEEVQCDNCDENDLVVAYCPNCSSFLCQVCYSYHKRDRTTRNHGVVVLSEIITNPNQTDIKTLQCREHGSNDLQYYCETCDELICLYCTVKEHKDHKHDIVKKMAAKVRHTINENMVSVGKKLTDLLKLHSDVEMMISQIKNQEDAVFKEIDEHYDTLIDNIKERKHQIQQQVSLAVLEKVKALTLQLEEIDFMQMQFLYMKEQNNAVKKSSNPDEKLLSIQKEITAYTKQWKDAYDELEKEPAESDTIQFFCEEVPFPQFGQVLSKADPCEAELSNLPKYIFQDVPVEFFITAKYSNGCKYPKGGNRISVQVQPQPESEEVVCDVKDNKDGTYVATFTVKKVGKVKVSVFFDGKPIKDSPFNITVSRNYPAVTKPTDIIDISGHSHNAKPWGIAFSKNGTWAVADWTNNCVCVFYKEDQLLWKFGSKGCNDGQLDNPCGIAFDNNNHLYVADYNNHRVQKFDINGNYLLQFTGKQSGDGCLSTPVDITIHKGMVYVTDATANCVVKFYTNGQFCQVIGKGYLNNPNGVTVNCNNHLLVTNLGDDCVYIFTLDGKYLGKFGTSGPGREQLSCPRSITSDLNGFILITDTGNHRISIFNKDGKYVHCFGCKGTGNSQFLAPRGVALAPNGSIYISDNLNKCIKIFEV